MQFTIERYGNEPIIILSPGKQYDVSRDTERLSEEVTSMITSIGVPTVVVADARNVPLTFGSMIQGIGIITRGENAFFKHPLLRKFVVVTGSQMSQLGVSVLNKSRHNDVPTIGVTTLEDALEHAVQVVGVSATG
jgi:hypothetical protein